MPATDIRRRYAFALGLLALVAWAVILGLGASDGHHSSGTSESASTHVRPSGSAAGADGREGPAVGRSAIEFTDAYLGYQVGASDAPGRRVLGRLSTQRLGAELRRALPRIPQTGAPPREWASRVEAVHVGIFEGRPAILVGVLVVGVNGSHVLTPTFVRSGSRWLVAGIGR